jgi:Double zinc ribbon
LVVADHQMFGDECFAQGGEVMGQAQSLLSPELGKRAVRFALTVVGLLILRAVLGALPMLTNASAISDSMMSPLVIADAVVDTLILVVLLQFGVALGRTVGENSIRFPDVGKIMTLATLVVALLIAYRQYETPTACLIVSPSDLSKAGQSNPTPINLDQIIPGFGQTLQGIARAQVNMATGATLAAYQRIAVIVLRQPPDIYGWTFLILIAIPVVGIVVLVSRNLDAFTEAVFHAASPPQARSAVTGAAAGVSSAVQCSNCGQPMTAGSKFCPNCGTASSSPTSIASARKVCPSCGADNTAGARFCKECGQAA